ncbi:VanZ family protein [Ferruginibacter sp. SUN106]|uniref:VanZ family protein n=1 Tax=Ferruginibacter sp. SUN106 TaxID=2978348 RepID=UPI003D368280
MQAYKPFIKKFSWVLLLIFLLVLTKVILFKGSPRYYKNYFRTTYHNYTVAEGKRKANFKPFATIKLFYESRRLNMEYKVSNLLGNILLFIPLGFLLPLLVKRFRNVFVILLTGFLLSLFYECTQLVTGIGVFDVDDMILNTTGTLIGIIIFYILKSLFPNKPQATNNIAASATPN